MSASTPQPNGTCTPNGWDAARYVALLPWHERPVDKVVLSVIAAHINVNGDSWPSRMTVAALAGVSERHVTDAVRRLTKAGHLAVERRHRAPNRYRLPSYLASLTGTMVPGSGLPCTGVRGSEVPARGEPEFPQKGEAEFPRNTKGEIQSEVRAPRRVEVSFGEDPAAEQWQMRNAAWAQAAKAAGLSDFAAGAVAGQVLAGMDAAVKGGEAIDDVLAVLPDLAQELATKPNASASRLDIPLRRLHARRAAEQPPPVVRRAPPLEPEPETAEELAAWNDERTRRMREQMVNPPVDEPSTVVCLDLSARVSALAARMGAR